MNTTTATITVEVLESDHIEVRQTCEYAAWYTLWKVLPGTYELKREMGKFWPNDGFPLYVAEVDAEVIEDYYAVHFGGVPVSKYDIHKNAGNLGKVSLRFTPAQLLKHEAVQVPEEDYEKILDEAMAYMKYRAAIDLGCIDKLPDGLSIAKLEWIGGHAESLARHARLYEEFYYTRARREHNRMCAAEGRTGWKDPKETHAKKVNRTWVGIA